MSLGSEKLLVFTRLFKADLITVLFIACGNNTFVSGVNKDHDQKEMQNRSQHVHSKPDHNFRNLFHYTTVITCGFYDSACNCKKLAHAGDRIYYL
jgi:hypothetical protein